MKLHVVYTGKYYSIFRPIWLNLADESASIYNVTVYYVTKFYNTCRLVPLQFLHNIDRSELKIKNSI